MKIKIIDLLNKIANGEEPPKKISFLDKEYEYHKDHMDYFDSNWGSLFQRIIDEYYEWLNMEVEILQITITNKQDDKIEQIYPLNNESDEFRVLADKINEIIDKVNDL